MSTILRVATVSRPHGAAPAVRHAAPPSRRPSALLANPPSATTLPPCRLWTGSFSLAVIMPPRRALAIAATRRGTPAPRAPPLLPLAAAAAVALLALGPGGLFAMVAFPLLLVPAALLTGGMLASAALFTPILAFAAIASGGAALLGAGVVLAAQLAALTLAAAVGATVATRGLALFGKGGAGNASPLIDPTNAIIDVEIDDDFDADALRDFDARLAARGRRKAE